MPDGSSSEVRIQPGVHAGTAITITGSAVPGQRRVDATFTIEQQEPSCSDGFVRHRDNLVCRVPVGATRLQTLDGRTIEIPVEPTESDCIVVVGEGMPILHGDGLKGNLIIKHTTAAVEVTTHAAVPSSAHEVLCPICGENVPTANIHLHLVHCKLHHSAPD